MAFDIPDHDVLEEVRVRAEYDAAERQCGHERPRPAMTAVAVGAICMRIAEFCWLILGRES